LAYLGEILQAMALHPYEFRDGRCSESRALLMGGKL